MRGTDVDVKARVIAHHRAHRLVKTDSGDMCLANARTRGDTAVVGDNVLCTRVDDNTLCIESVQDRRSVLARTDRRGRNRILASNFDCIVVVTAPKPGIDRLIIDQYLVAAENIGVEPILLINKVDLLTPESENRFRIELECYKTCGCEVVFCSAHTPASLQPFLEILHGRVCIFVGPSGVGKSSLIQHCVPNREVTVGALSRSGLGSHTTVAAYWYETGDSGAVIDSPGVREFRVDHLGATDIARGFRDVYNAAADCKFHNCSHRHEPQCAVKTGVESGEIDATRYSNYLSLLADAEQSARH